MAFRPVRLVQPQLGLPPPVYLLALLKPALLFRNQLRLFHSPPEPVLFSQLTEVFVLV